MKKICLVYLVCMASASVFAQKSEPLTAAKNVAPQALSTPVNLEAKVKAAKVLNEAAAVNIDEKLKAAEVVNPVADVNANYKAAPVQTDSEAAATALLLAKKVVPEQKIKETIKKGKE